MVAYVRANSIISDFTVGSVARTLLEAAAFEDDEQYFQMVQLLDAFSVLTARGERLDRRMADFGRRRLPPNRATVKVRFFDTGIVTSRLATDVASGAASISLFDSSKFPTSGFPYNIRIGEGTTRLQDVTVLGHSLTTRTLTLGAPLLNDLIIGDRVNLITGSVARTISRNIGVSAGATVTQAARLYTTTESAYITPGNFFSNQVTARSTVTGTVGNVAAGRIALFTGAKPYATAGVTNPTASSGGSARESDGDFLTRALGEIQGLSRGTPLAVRTASVGVVDPGTQQRSVSSNSIEDFVNDEVIVYIDDGTGLVPTTQSLPTDTISTGGGPLAFPSPVVPVADAGAMPSIGTYLIEADPTAELVEVISKNVGANTLQLASPTTLAHADGSSISFVDVLDESAEPGRRRFQFQNYPVVRGSERVYVNSGGGIIELTPEVDYVLNRGIGSLQIVDTSGVAGNSIVFAQYTYYTNLIATVQKVLEGDPDNPVTFPGVKAAGIFLSVEPPTKRRITVTASISAKPGFVEANLRTLVQDQISAYISSRKLGEDVIISNMVARALSVNGVLDVRISSPTANVSVLENELPVSVTSENVSLISVI
jgi:uncharacterized phage protein gp47/JayE